jgi:Mg/Co/Ni transporter MgtE
MTKLAEIQEAITALPPQEQAALIKWLMEEESPEMLAAIDEADRSFAAEGGVEAEAVRRNLRQWLTG